MLRSVLCMFVCLSACVCVFFYLLESLHKLQQQEKVNNARRQAGAVAQQGQKDFGWGDNENNSIKTLFQFAPSHAKLQLRPTKLTHRACSYSPTTPLQPLLPLLHPLLDCPFSSSSFMCALPAGALHKVSSLSLFMWSKFGHHPRHAPSATSMPCLLWYLAIVAATVVVVVLVAVT